MLPNTKLSSSWTSILPIFLIVLIILNLFVTWVAYTEDGFTFGLVIYLLVVAALVYFIIYLVRYSAHARVENNRLYVQKLFQEEKVYDFNAVTTVNNTTLRRTNYTRAQLKNADGSLEKFLILSTNSFFGSSKLDVKDLLLQMKNGYIK